MTRPITLASGHYLQMDATVDNIFAIFDKTVDGIRQSSWNESSCGSFV